MTDPVFMMNDIGGIVYADKNELCLIFAAGYDQTIHIDTKKLLTLLESRSKVAWKTKEFEINPMFLDPRDKALFVIITVPYNETDDDQAIVFRCDLLEVLKSIECTESV